MKKIRIDKMLSDHQFGSRQEIKQLIKSQAIKIGGQLISDSSLKVSYGEEIMIYDQLYIFDEFVYLMMNKPEGVECSHQSNNPTIYQLLEKHVPNNLFSVGRLDLDTTGLLLITNDGDWAHRIVSKKNHSIKKYLVTLNDQIDSRIEKLNQPIFLQPEGEVLAKSVDIISDYQLILGITDGKYHQVKRMIAYCGYEVMALERISIGGLDLDSSLEKGQFRTLTFSERELVFND